MADATIRVSIPLDGWERRGSGLPRMQLLPAPRSVPVVPWTARPPEEDPNPYLTAFRAAPTHTLDPGSPASSLILRYSWAVPTEEALSVIADYSPILEIGAGLGYWAYLLRKRGVDIVAYDRFKALEYQVSPPRLWTEVKKGGPERIKDHPRHTLFLCAPDYSVANACLRDYAGNTILFVAWGMGSSDPAALLSSDVARTILADEFMRSLTVILPTWTTPWDPLGRMALAVFNRRATPR